MNHRENNHLTNRAFRRELEERYDGAKECVCCGEPIDEPIWHHILPVAQGGQDIPSNLVPVCECCHKAIHSMKPSWRYKTRSGGGRPIEKPDRCYDIFEDYVRCRIAKSEAAYRLKKGIHFMELKIFQNYKKENGIVSYKNNLDIRIAKNGHNELSYGVPVGSIQYADGTEEIMLWGVEEPITGESFIEILNSPKKIKAINYKKEYYGAV